jgi:hypothetical protein
MSSDTYSFNSECQDDEEIALAMQAAEIANRNEARAKFRCVCICVCVTIDSPAENKDSSNCPCRDNVLWDLRFAQWFSWGFRSSEIRGLVVWVVHDVSKECSAFFKGQGVKKNSHSQEIVCIWLRHQKPIFRIHVSRDSSVSTATCYRLDVPGIKSRWSEISRTCSDRPWGSPSLLYNGYWVFPPGGKVARVWRWPPTPI